MYGKIYAVHVSKYISPMDPMRYEHWYAVFCRSKSYILGCKWMCFWPVYSPVTWVMECIGHPKKPNLDFEYRNQPAYWYCNRIYISASILPPKPTACQMKDAFYRKRSLSSQFFSRAFALSLRESLNIQTPPEKVFVHQKHSEITEPQEVLLGV